MQHCIVLILIFQFATVLLAQDQELQYLDAAFNTISDKETAAFYREVATEGDLYCSKTYYPAGQLKMTGCYSDPELSMEEGEFVFYYRNGQIESKGMYSEGMKYGVWKRFYWDGEERPDRYYSGLTTEQLTQRQTLGSAASFPGGVDSLDLYLDEQLIYPEAALNQELEGSVEVTFIIDENGSIQNPTVSKSAHYYLDKEALRLVQNMPRWEPATKGSHNVASQFVLPVFFHLPPKD